MAGRSSKRRKRKPERSSPPATRRRGEAQNVIPAWQVSWTDRNGKTHTTYHATLHEAVTFASNKSGYVSKSHPDSPTALRECQMSKDKSDQMIDH